MKLLIWITLMALIVVSGCRSEGTPAGQTDKTYCDSCLSQERVLLIMFTSTSFIEDFQKAFMFTREQWEDKAYVWEHVKNYYSEEEASRYTNLDEHEVYVPGMSMVWFDYKPYPGKRWTPFLGQLSGTFKVDSQCLNVMPPASDCRPPWASCLL